MIPKLHYISQGNSATEQLENIQKACTAGIELVQLHCKVTSEKKFLKLAAEVRDITSHFQTRLIVTDNYKIAKEIKADGVYLDKIGAFPTSISKQLYSWQLIGGLANTMQDCEALLDKQVNYIGLGPFKHSDYVEQALPSLGLNGYTAITDILKTGTPIIGFGSITIEDAKSILATGISGIAVGDAITSDFNSIKIFNGLLNASSNAEQRYGFE